MLDFLSDARNKRRSVNPWLVAIVLAIGAWVFTNLAWTVLQPRVSVLFLGAVGLAAYYGGIFPGLFAALVNFGLEYLFLWSHAGNTTPTRELWEGSLMLLAAAILGYAADRRYNAEQHSITLASDLARVREELASQKVDFSWFHRASVRLTSSLELSTLLKEIVSVVTILQGTEAGVLLLRQSLLEQENTRENAQEITGETANESHANESSTKLGLAAHIGLSTAQLERLQSLDSSQFSLRRRVVLEDTEAPGRMAQAGNAALELGFRALFSTPILTREGEPLGVVVSFFSQSHQPSEREIQAMELYARQAANAIENARSYGTSVSSMHMEQRRAAVLRSLSEASVLISSTLALDSLLQIITDRAREIVGAHQAFTSLAPSGNWSQSINCVSLSRKYASSGRPHPERPEMFLLACALNKPLLVTAETQQNQPWWSAASAETARTPPKGWMAAPLLARDGRNLGLIQLSDKIEGEFNEEDQSILVQLAQMASVAVENVRLYREAQEQLSERSRAKEALRRSKDTLHLAQRAAGVGIFEWDLQNGDISWSDEIAVLHEVQPGTFNGKYETWINAIHEEDREQVHKAVARAIANSTEYEVQYRVLPQGDSPRWLEARGQAFHASGTPMLMLGVAMDITSRKQAEEALRKSEQLAATGRLAATIAHEVNNPLAAVTNVLYLLRMHSSLNAEALGYVATAEAELSRVTHITRQTLGFYREIAHPVDTNLSAVLDEILDIYARQIEAGGVTVEKNYRFDGTILAFQSELRQVFSNLILNALQAIPERGAGKLRLHVTRLEKANGVDGINVTVADNGSGIRPENRERIFEPFFTTKGQKGTGLGLWVSQGIVHKHGGRVRARSFARGNQRATCFTVFLPFEYVKRTTPPEPVEAAAA